MGDIISNGYSLSFSQVRMTAMGCPTEDDHMNDIRLFGIFKATRSYALENNRLVLFDEQKNRLLVMGFLISRLMVILLEKHTIKTRER